MHSMPPSEGLAHELAALVTSRPTPSIVLEALGWLADCVHPASSHADSAEAPLSEPDNSCSSALTVCEEVAAEVKEDVRAAAAALGAALLAGGALTVHQLARLRKLAWERLTDTSAAVRQAWGGVLRLAAVRGIGNEVQGKPSHNYQTCIPGSTP